MYKSFRVLGLECIGCIGFTGLGLAVKVVGDWVKGFGALGLGVQDLG